MEQLDRIEKELKEIQMKLNKLIKQMEIKEWTS